MFLKQFFAYIQWSRYDGLQKKSMVSTKEMHSK